MSRNLLILLVLSLVTTVGVAQDVEVNAGKWQVSVNETSGKAVLGICGVVILVTALFMIKFTKPVEYKR